MKNETPQKNWTEDLDSLKNLPPSPNKREHPINPYLMQEDYDAIDKRLSRIERQIESINLKINIKDTTFRKLRKQLHQLEGETHGSPSRPQTDSK